MAIDPRIILAGRSPDIGAAFSNALLNVQRGQQIRQTSEEAPLRNRLLQAQASTAEAGEVETRQLNRIRSLAVFGNDIAGDLQAGNLSAIRDKTLTRINEQLPGQGLPSNDSQELLELIDNPDISEQDKLDQISQLAQQANQKARDFGVLRAPSGTASERDFQTFQALQAKAQGPGATQEDITRANQFGRQAGFIRESAQEIADIRVKQAIDIAAGGAAVELETKPEIEAAVVAAKGAAEAETEIGATELAVKRLARDETKIKNEQERLELIGAKEASIAESTNAISRINGLLTGDRFSAGFGKLVTNTPETLRSQEAIDVIAELDQIRGLVSLESRQKLKGQGTISDSEAKTLERSATVLSNPLISDKLARKELQIIKKVFEKSIARNQLAKSTREGRLVKQPEAASQVIRFDAQGNQL